MSCAMKLFTRVDTPGALVVSLISVEGDENYSGKSVHISVALDDAARMYGKEFKESEACSGQDWMAVTSSMRDAFVHNTCSLACSGTTVKLTVPKVGSFTIPTTDVRPTEEARGPPEVVIQTQMLTQMANWSALFMNRDKQSVLERKVDSAEKEAENYRVQLNNSNHNPDEIQVCVRNPLAPHYCREFDLKLLQMIKAQVALSDDPDADEPNNLDDEEDPKRCVEVMLPQDYAALKAEVLAANPASPPEMLQYKAVHSALTHLDEWEYDVFAMQTAMSGGVLGDALTYMPQGGCLAVTAFALFHKYGLLRQYEIDEQTFLNWCSVVESGYHPNPYHNSVHAADVLHITHYVLSKGGLQETVSIQQEDIFSALFAAAIHDYNHPGINNNFHIQARTYLATLFNDKHVLENMHVSSVFELMKMPQYDICKSMDDETKRSVKDTITELVLATDMAMHAKIVATFKRKLFETRQLSRKEDVRLALQVTLKIADISNCCRPHNLYINWCNHITDEFYLQGDRERGLGHAVSPFMDRFDPTVAKGQIAFMSYVVIPLFECFSEFLPKLVFTIDHCNKNKAFWAEPQ
eukprot:TRINITY_DN150_c0_g3_i1.p1 TRINITY_DN150_c0_g3~~TRINITY_DN150_c0_g3_i1.p1  ORF type:complete len:580 (+),score=167.90 TRINITY_DN150_c0_g3_i1:140-1879(+)